MNNEGKRGKRSMLWGFIYVITFIAVFSVSAVIKLSYNPLAKAFAFEWNDSVGKIYNDFSYGDGEANKFDLYVPAGNTKETYGLVIYLNAGGFTAGDKSGDAEILKLLCSKGYVAAGINYTLRDTVPNPEHRKGWTADGISGLFYIS